jgi:hypothetical protein
MSFWLRKVHTGGRIKFKHRWWSPRNSAESLVGRKFIFGDYLPSEPNLLCLWGTPEMYHCESLDSEEGSGYWREFIRLMCDKVPNDLLHTTGGIHSFFMDGMVGYESLGFEFWHPIEMNKQT